MSLSIGQLVGYVDMDTGPGEKAIGSFSGLLDKLPGQWGKALGGAAVAAGGLFGASLAGAMNMEPANDRVAAALNLSEKQAERAGKVAGQVYADNWGESTEEVAGAVEAVISSIKGMRTASESELRKVTTQALTFASVMGVDVGRAAQVAGNMVNNGLAKNATEAFDLLTRASSKVPVELREDVLDATDEYGQFFNTLGIKGPQAMGMLAAGAAKGMYGIDKAGDAVKEFTIRSTDMSTSSVAAYKMIGLNAGDMARSILAGGNTARKATGKIVDGLLGIKDPAKRANASIALFGTPLEDLNTRDIPKFLRSLRDGAKGLGDWRGATDKAGKTMSDNAAGNIASFTRGIKMAFIDMIGGKVLPKVTELTGLLNQGLGPAIDAVTGFLADHQGIAEPVAVVLGTLATGLLAVAAATKTWAIAQGVLNAVLAMNPIGLVVIAIAGLVAGLIYAYKKSETFRSIVNGAFSGVKAVAGKVLDWLSKAVRKTIDFVRSHWKLIVSILGGPIAAAVVLVTSNWSKIKGAVTGAVSAVVGFVKRNWQSILATLIAGPFGLAVSLVVKHWGSIRNAVTSSISKVIGVVRTLPGKIKGALGDLGSLLYNSGRELISGLARGMLSKLGEVASTAKSIAGKIKGYFPGSPVKEGPLTSWNSGGAGKRLMDMLAQGIRSRRGKVRDSMHETALELTATGRSIKDSLLAGLAEGGDGMESVLDKVADTTRGLFEDRAEVLADGIEKRYAKALEARKKAIESKHDAIEKGLRKKLKGDKLSKALAKNRAAQDQAMTAAENGNRKARNGELRKSEQASKANQSAVLKIMRSQRAALIENARLQEVMAESVKNATDELERQLEVHNSYAASVRESFNSFGDVTQFVDDAGTTSADAIVAGVQTAVDKANQYRSAMDRLIDTGLNQTMLDQIKSRGVEGGLAVAQAIIDGGPTTVNQLNALGSQLDAAGAALGGRLADRLYGEGIAAQTQLVAGLTSDYQAVVDAGTQMAQAFVQAMHAELAKQQTGATFSVATAVPSDSGKTSKDTTKAAGKGKNGGKGKGGDGGKGKNDRSAPLIGTVVQRQGESADSLAEKLWYKTRKRG